MRFCDPGSRRVKREFGSDVDRVAKLAFADCPLEAQERIATLQFIDGISDTDVQDLVRMAQPKSLPDALSKALGFETSRQATRATHRNLRRVEVELINSTCKEEPASYSESPQAPQVIPQRRYRRYRRRRQNDSPSTAAPSNVSQSGNGQMVDLKGGVHQS